jgi:D-aspartate ligase
LNASAPVVVLAWGHGGHAAARSLGRLGVPIYGVHPRRGSPAAASRFWRRNFVWDQTAASAEESVDWLLRLSRRIGSRPILVPTDDTSCLLVADHAVVLKDAFLFPDQPPGLARALSSKQGMYNLCQEHGIPTPETVFPRSRDDVCHFIEGAAFPVVLKGIDGTALKERTGVRLKIVDDAESLLRSYDEMEAPDAPNLMIQEHIPGSAETIWMFNGYFDAASTCLFGLTGRKIRQYPAYTGLTSLGSCAPNDIVATRTISFMRDVGYRGILDIGYKYDSRTGEYKLLDVNPRLGMTFRLFVDTFGMDVARAMYRDLTGQPFAPGELRDGRRWLSEAFDVMSSLTYYRDGKLTPGQWLRSFRGVEEAAWFARDDLAPFVMIAADSLAFAARRARSTIANTASRRRRAASPRRRPVRPKLGEEAKGTGNHAV